MGCTTSVIVFDGLRSALQRNCGYWKSTSAAAPHRPAETEAAHAGTSETRAWPVSAAVEVWDQPVCSVLVCGF